MKTLAKLTALAVAPTMVFIECPEVPHITHCQHWAQTADGNLGKENVHVEPNLYSPLPTIDVSNGEVASASVSLPDSAYTLHRMEREARWPREPQRLRFPARHFIANAQKNVRSLLNTNCAMPPRKRPWPKARTNCD